MNRDRRESRPWREARELILERVPECGTERVTLEEARGRVLAEACAAPFDLPGEDTCAIDGFTFALEGVERFPATLEIVGESRAGVPYPKRIGPGEAVATMTGALVPEGADTAVRIEDVTVEGSRVTIPRAPKRGDLVNPAGSELKRGEAVLEAGRVLDDRSVALLAHLAHYTPRVRTRPRIGILVTGDEVREPWESPELPGVRNSNHYILREMLAPYAEIRYYGIVRDDPERLLPRFREALADNDLLLSSGGASKGRYDFTREIAAELGLEIHFTRTNIRPGRPLIFGTRGEKLFFGLPGYPAALLANARLFLLPAVRKLAGMREALDPLVPSVVAETLRAKEGRVDLVRVNLEYREGRIFVRSAGSQQTSNFRTMAQCDALAILDESRGSAEEGEIVPLLLLR